MRLSYNYNLGGQTMNYVVETDNIVKVYGSNKAVDKVSMHVPEGSIYGFVGENGSGKTTIMRILTGLASPNEGTYKLFGVGFKEKGIYDVRHQISSLVENVSLVPSMTAKENLQHAALYYGVKPLKDYSELLKIVGLEGVGKKKAKNYSLGMRQRLGIAILLLNNPKLMFLDEPMNGLDPTGIAELRELILSLNRQGITIVISSHILSELEKVANFYGFINKGKILKEISSEELVKECQRGQELRYHDIKKLEAALAKIGYHDLQKSTTSIKVIGEVKPRELLDKLSKEGIEIDDIRTIDVSVEDYYLHLVQERGL